MSLTSPLIQLEAVSKVFMTDELETHALAGVDLQVRQGEFVAISGPSGCGKTTMLSILGLLEPPTSGQYLLDGRSVATLDRAERARVRNRQIGFIFQAFNLISGLTVFENVELPLTYRGLGTQERRERVAGPRGLDAGAHVSGRVQIGSCIGGGSGRRAATSGESPRISARSDMTRSSPNCSPCQATVTTTRK